MNLIFVRHGQSIWNLENRFTGWVDVELSERGVKEAEEAGSTLLSFHAFPPIHHLEVYSQLILTFVKYLYSLPLFPLTCHCSIFHRF